MKPHVFAVVLLALPGAAFAGTPEAGQDRQAQPREQMRFRAMDANNDGVITRKEWRGSDQSFRAHDWNGDDMLSGSEVRVGGRRDDPGREEEDDYDQTRRPEFRNWTERGFANLDHNSDGRIARSEWHYDREAFLRADRNRDNVLTKEEFLGEDIDSDREDRFEYLDANNNNRIERSEWHGSRDTFEWLDRNNDGALSRVEVVGEESEQGDLFASLDVNSDNLISSNEWHWSRRSFTRQDANGDGQLTRSELTNAELNATNAGATGTAGRTVAVGGTERWIDTGLNVRAGDTVSIQANGTVTLSSNNADSAGPGGVARRAPAAPLPNQPAGALIARIDDSTPVFVGDRGSIVASQAGRLYLGINDDHLDDNRGEFRVTVSRR
jgi:Ca2+-binding EF-hand superfamily protein